MFANERYEAIIALLRTQPSVSVPELTRRFGVSIETVRRDLSYLEQQGTLRRVHGGAVPVHNEQLFKSLDERRQMHTTEKRRLAEAAAELVRESDWLFLDSGSTALVFAEVLRERFTKLSVVTYSLEVMVCLAEQPGFSVYLSGGQYLRSEQAFFGSAARAFFDRYHASRAFLCPTALSLKDGVCDFTEELVDVQRAMMANADETIFLADASKFSASAPVHLCPLNAAGLIITDPTFPAESTDLFRQQGISLRIATE